MLTKKYHLLDIVILKTQDIEILPTDIGLKSQYMGARQEKFVVTKNIFKQLII